MREHLRVQVLLGIGGLEMCAHLLPGRVAGGVHRISQLVRRGVAADRAFQAADDAVIEERQLTWLRGIDPSPRDLGATGIHDLELGLQRMPVTLVVDPGHYLTCIGPRTVAMWLARRLPH